MAEFSFSIEAKWSGLCWAVAGKQANNNNNETILKNKDYDKNASEFLNNNSSSDGYSRNFLGETITHSKF